MWSLTDAPKFLGGNTSVNVSLDASADASSYFQQHAGQEVGIIDWLKTNETVNKVMQKAKVWLLFMQRTFSMWFSFCFALLPSTLSSPRLSPPLDSLLPSTLSSLRPSPPLDSLLPSILCNFADWRTNCNNGYGSSDERCAVWVRSTVIQRSLASFLSYCCICCYLYIILFIYYIIY